jgi:hypothetical protein
MIKVTHTLTWIILLTNRKKRMSGWDAIKHKRWCMITIGARSHLIDKVWLVRIYYFCFIFQASVVHEYGEIEWKGEGW